MTFSAKIGGFVDFFAATQGYIIHKGHHGTGVGGMA